MCIRRVLNAGEPQETFCGREDKLQKRTEKQNNKNAIKSILTFSCWKRCRQPSCLPIEDVPFFFFLSSVKDRNICTLYGQSEHGQATAGGKRGGVTAFWETVSSSALCAFHAWGTGGYFWNIILNNREGLSGFISSVGSGLQCQSSCNCKL